MLDRDDTNADMPTTERVLVYFMQPFLNAGQILYTDTFYTSPSLAKHLDNNMHLWGAVQTNGKYYCSDLVSVNLEKDQATFFESTTNPRVLADKYLGPLARKPTISRTLSTCFLLVILLIWLTPVRRIGKGIQ